MTKTILITGGTSGIGYSLVKEYLDIGYQVITTGRTPTKVQKLNKELENSPTFLGAYSIDVTNEEKMQKFIYTMDTKYKLDIVIANAGISGGIIQKNINSNDLLTIMKNTVDADTNKAFKQQAKNIFNTNVMGVFNTVHPAMDVMQLRKEGQIVIMSSMSAFFGLKGALFYAASKSAVKSYGEGLRLLLKEYNIKVNTVFPGFVESNITAENKFKMPFLMKGKKSAKLIIKGLQKNKGFIIFPKTLYFLVYLISILPFTLREKILNKIPNK